MSLPSEAATLISEALAIIDSQVQITLGTVAVTSTGSEGRTMEAARKLQTAHELCPDDASVHYAYACSLHLAAQYESARSVMQACAESHPTFALAQLALQNWTNWRSPFMLPPWSGEARTVHPAISQAVLVNDLRSVRDGLLPRAALFLRDSAGDFQDLQALRSAEITLATVISPVSNPQVIGVYAKIYDNPSSPYDVEYLEIPFRPRGHPTRSTLEYLFIQEDMDFVVIDRQDRILLNKRLPMSARMRETNREALEKLSATEGRDISTGEVMQAIQNHQRQFAPSDVRY